MKSRKVLTPAEARNALYIDFEGGKGVRPVLLGCTHRNGPKRAMRYVADPLFHSLASDRDVVAMPSLEATVERILQRAKSNRALIVAWSPHEWEIVRDHCPDLLPGFEARYVNAKLVVERWRNKCHAGDKRASGKLGDYLGMIGYEVPDRAGPGHVGDTVRDLRARFETGRPPTSRQLERWRDLLEHNKHDCVGMRRLCLLAADEMAVSRGPT
jgi:hypothetical protein